jgi:hypothetical protein
LPEPGSAQLTKEAPTTTTTAFNPSTASATAAAQPKCNRASLHSQLVLENIELKAKVFVLQKQLIDYNRQLMEMDLQVTQIAFLSNNKRVVVIVVFS